MDHITRIGALLDPTTRTAALPDASDDELIIAAISRNAEPIYPGLDESTAAFDLALLVLNTKSQSGLEIVLRESLRWVSAGLLLDLITELHGRNRRDTPDTLTYLLGMPHSQAMITVICESLLPRQWFSANTELLERLIKVSTDVAFLETAASHSNKAASMAAHLRLMVLDPLSEGSAVIDATAIAAKNSVKTENTVKTKSTVQQ